MKDIILIRSGGDISTGVIQKFFRAGFKIIVAEVKNPTTIRTTVSLSQSVYDQNFMVEDVTGELANNLEDIKKIWEKNFVPIIIDPELKILEKIKVSAVIDGIIAKKNLGTNLKMAPITIGLGPGFVAGKDVNIVIETMRGHDLGRLIFKGEALKNTGTPGLIENKGVERVIHSPVSGYIKSDRKIGDMIKKGEIIFFVENTPVKAKFTGLIRGHINKNLFVKKGLKIADIDPRLDVDYKTISDKARNIGGASLEAYLYLKNKNNLEA